MPCGCGKNPVPSRPYTSHTVQPAKPKPVVKLNQRQILENIKKDVEKLKKKHSIK